MATAHIIQITPDNTGLWKIQQDEASAKKASELLQEDLEVGRALIIKRNTALIQGLETSCVLQRYGLP